MNISAVVICKNEEKNINECLESLGWASEIVLIDSGSTDATIEVASKHKVNIVKTTKGSYDTWRTLAINKAKYDWIFYLDADERVTSELRQEILKVINLDQKYAYYAIPRKNIILGKVLLHGGWYPDFVKRLFRKRNLLRWKGHLHEEPVVEGELGFLKSPIIHLKHDSLSPMLTKTNKWSEIEATNLFNINHPHMVGWRFIRIMLTEFNYRVLLLRGFMDGSVGIIYSIYQTWSRFITYAKLWEMQRLSENRGKDTT